MSALDHVAIDLPPPQDGRPDLLVIAGEHSGDEHAAQMVSGLKSRYTEANIVVIGGKRLQAAGGQLLFDLTAFSVVGFAEVLKHYRFFKKLLALTFEWIQTHRPRHICFVDYPGFNLRLAERLFKTGLTRKGGGSLGALYYISPQVWAWKRERRFKMARYLDGLGVIFPFEVDFFSDTDLPVDFVGHPFMIGNGRVRYAAEGPLLLLPGSRRAAVNRIFPLMLAALERFFAEGGSRSQEVLAVYPSPDICEVQQRWLDQKPKLRYNVQLVSHAKPIAGRAVLTSSGTMSLACALAGLPGAIVYRAHPLTYLCGRLLVTVSFLGIANLLLGKPMYLEFIQGKAKAARLADEIKRILYAPERLAATQRSSKQLRAMLSQTADSTPSAWLARHVFPS